MERVRAELDRLKASKAAMAEERARLMADGLESDDVEMEDMDRAGSGRRGSTSFDGERRGGTLNPLTAGSTSLSGSPLMSPMGSLTGGDETSAARGGGNFFGGGSVRVK